MTPFTITLDARRLLAVSLFTAKKDIRYYLNGLLIEEYEGKALLVACDGHRIAVWRTGVDVPVDTRLIVHNDLLRYVRPKHSVLLSANDQGFVTIEYLGIQYSTRAVDGKFPQWRDVVPREKPSGEAANFNPAYLMDFVRACKLLFPSSSSHHQPTVAHNGSKAALVDFGGDKDFFGLVMPLHVEVNPNVPKWMPPAAAKPESAIA